MNIKFNNIPTLFGPLHICFLILTIIISFLIYFLLRNKNEDLLIKILSISGIILILLEIWKQFFTYNYVFNKEYNMWFFPWQLCSMGMYVSTLLPLFNKDKQNYLLIFLATYSLFGAIVALLLPYDMLREQVLLTYHSFIYHIVLICQSIIAIIILRYRNDKHFKPTLFLFLAMSLVAEIINIISHLIFNDIHKEAETYLFMAALDDSRDKALRQMIIPHDEIGIIFYDRTILDTYVYQTLTQKSKVNPFTENIFKLPDIQFILDLAPEIGFKRIKLNNRETNRFDEKSLDYHREIHVNFLKSYEELHNKIDSYMFVIDANRDINDILNNICETIDYTYFRESYYDYHNNQRHPFWSNRS